LLDERLRLSVQVPRLGRRGGGHGPAGRGSELPMEYHWPRYSVRITIERAGDEPICSAMPLPGAPTVGAESSPDTN
jgi:hypothetical protein